MDKPALRKHYLALRHNLPAQQRIEAEHAICAKLLELALTHGESAGYAAMRGEVSLDALGAALAERSLSYALPRAEKELLSFRHASGEALERGAHGQLEPPASAPLRLPQIIFIPLLAFDRRGHRLGYGGGYYDRTLEQLRLGSTPPLAIGVAFCLQEAPALPAEPHDQLLDMIVTEREIINIYQ